MRKILYILIFTYSIGLIGQEVITLDYKKENNIIVSDKYKIKDGETYIINVTNINSAHIKDFSTLKASRYVSETPEILKSIFLDISDNSVFDLFEPPNSNARKAFLMSLKYFNELEEFNIKSEKLYAETFLLPNIKKSKGVWEQIKIALGVNSFDELYVKLQNNSKFLALNLESYKSQIAEITISDSTHSSFLSEYSILKRLNEKVESFDLTTKMLFIKNSLTASNNINIKTFIAEKDLVDLDLRLFDTFSKDTIYNGKISFKTYNNFTFDFSTGFFYSNLIEEKYFLSRRDENVNNVLKDNIDKIDVSIGALGHFVFKFTPSFSSGIALGASISPFDGNLRYLIGPTFLFGHRQKLGLSIGLSIANIEQLSDSIEKDEMGFFVSSTETDIKTIEKVATGFFFGLTYNLTNKKN